MASLKTEPPLLQLTHSWENPLTKKTILIDSKWKQSKVASPPDQTLFMFTEPTDHAAIHFGMVALPGASLEEYVAEIQTKLTATFHFTDRGRLFEQQGLRFWKGEGKLIDNPDIRLSLHIVQIGNAFWRVQTVQSLPYEFSDGQVTELQARLWETVPLQDQRTEPTPQPTKANIL